MRQVERDRERQRETGTETKRVKVSQRESERVTGTQGDKDRHNYFNSLISGNARLLHYENGLIATFITRKGVALSICQVKTTP